MQHPSAPHRRIATKWLVLLTLSACFAADVLMQHNNLARTGANLNETTLTPTTVRPGRFGRLWNLYADGQVVAQPLYVEGLKLGARTVNAIVIATMHNTLYVYDADREMRSASGRTAPIWSRWLGKPRPGEKGIDMWSTNDPEWGILGTPAIDAEHTTLYVVTWNSSQVDGYFYRIHALDLATGLDRQTPTRIGPSSNDPSKPCHAQSVFNPCNHKQRPALLLHQGHVFVAFGGDGNKGALYAMDAHSLQPKGFWSPTPDGVDGGIWQSGQGPAVDAAGNLFVSIGNGSFGGRNYGNSLVKLRFDGENFTVLDWFTPCNAKWLNQTDLDFGSSGPMLTGGAVIVGGKEGVLYSLPQNNLGKYKAGAGNCVHAQQVQSFAAFPAAQHGGQTHYGNIHGSAVYWKGPDAERVYVWGENSRLKAWRFKQGRFLDLAHPQMSEYQPPNGMPGGMLSLSANGNKDGIVWALVPLDGDANKQRGVQGVLLALDAQDVSRTLWSSELSPAADRPGLFAKFTSPTIAGGKVFVPTLGNAEERRVYGGNNHPRQPPAAYYVAVYGLRDERELTTVNQDSDDLTVVQATTTPLKLTGCEGLPNGSFDCTRALGAPAFHPAIVPAQSSCAVLTVTTAMKASALAGVAGVGFYSSQATGQFVVKPLLKSTGTATFRNGAAAVLHEFAGLVNCPGAHTFKPYAQFETTGKVFKNWDRSANYTISPAAPVLDRRQNVLLP